MSMILHDPPDLVEAELAAARQERQTDAPSRRVSIQIPVSRRGTRASVKVPNPAAMTLRAASRLHLDDRWGKCVEEEEHEEQELHVGSEPVLPVQRGSSEIRRSHSSDEVNPAMCIVHPGVGDDDGEEGDLERGDVVDAPPCSHCQHHPQDRQDVPSAVAPIAQGLRAMSPSLPRSMSVPATLPYPAEAALSAGSLTWIDRGGALAAAASLLASGNESSRHFFSASTVDGSKETKPEQQQPHPPCTACEHGRRMSKIPSRKWNALATGFHKSHHTIINGVDYTNLKRDFLMKISRALAMYGAPSHRLEFHLHAVSEAMGVESVFLVFPGMILISFGEEDHGSHMHLVKTYQGWNMSKLSDVNTLCLELVRGDVTIQTALDRLDEIKQRKGYGRLAYFLTFPTMSITFCIVGFGGSWIDAVFGGVFGCIVGGTSLLAERFPSFTYLCDFSSALVVSFLAKILEWGLQVQGRCVCFTFITVVLSGLVMLMP
ncbi:hypothetical protein HK104_006747, partial [Borealophlyctis nickersoniae]